MNVETTGCNEAPENRGWNRALFVHFSDTETTAEDPQTKYYLFIIDLYVCYGHSLLSTYFIGIVVDRTVDLCFFDHCFKRIFVVPIMSSCASS